MPWTRFARLILLRGLPPLWFRQELKGLWRSLVTPPDSIMEMA